MTVGDSREGWVDAATGSLVMPGEATDEQIAARILAVPALEEALAALATLPRIKKALADLGHGLGCCAGGCQELDGQHAVLEKLPKPMEEHPVVSSGSA